MLENDFTQISTEILQRLGAVKNAPTKDQIMVKCLNPEHIDHHASMSVSLSKGLCYCFACGYSGKLTSVYYKMTGNSIYKDLGISRNLFSFCTKKNTFDDSSFEAVPEVDFLFKGTLESIASSSIGTAWAKSRGFTPEFCELNNIKYCDKFEVAQKSDESNQRTYKHYAIIPIFEKNKLISFEARNTLSKQNWINFLRSKGVLVDEKMYKKVLYPPHSSINTLFQYEQLDRNDTLYITEGLMDMFSLRTNSAFKNSSCLFHCNPTERQVYLLKKFNKIVYVVDNDTPGLSACRKLMDKIPGKVFYLKPPIRKNIKDINDILQGKDATLKSVDDLLKMGWLNRISDDKDALDFSIREKQKAIAG